MGPAEIISLRNLPGKTQWLNFTLWPFLLHMSLECEPVARQSAVDTEPHPKLPGFPSLGRGDIFIREAQH